MQGARCACSPRHQNPIYTVDDRINSHIPCISSRCKLDGSGRRDPPRSRPVTALCCCAFDRLGHYRWTEHIMLIWSLLEIYTRIAFTRNNPPRVSSRYLFVVLNSFNVPTLNECVLWRCWLLWCWWFRCIIATCAAFSTCLCGPFEPRILQLSIEPGEIESRASRHPTP